MQEATLVISILSLLVSIVALVISTIISIKAHHHSDKEFKLNKRTEFYNMVNPFLLSLEYETLIEELDTLESIKGPKELDYECLDTLSKINAFCQINSIEKDKTKKFKNNLMKLSEDLQDTQLGVENSKSFKELNKEIKDLRYELKIMIESEDFIKLK